MTFRRRRYCSDDCTRLDLPYFAGRLAAYGTEDINDEAE
jgi:hypothetical protein